jgi:serine/threonine protein phosphatase PrpC
MAIFDGMGGHYGGQFASRAAVKALEQQRNLSDRDPRQWLAQMFDLVSAAISKEAEEIKQLIIDIGQRIQKEGLTSANCDELTALVNPLVDFELAGAHIRIVMQNLDANRTISLLEEILPDVEKMAATGVLAHVKMTGAGRWLVNVGNVGDPRAYLFAGNKLMQLTSDQTPFQDWLTNHGQGVSEKVALERKAAIEKAVTPGAVSGWLGHYDPERRFYSQPIELNSPFVLALLCDGIHKHQGVTDERLKSIFRRSTDATWLCRALMDAAAGALDDRTCVVLSIP